MFEDFIIKVIKELYENLKEVRDYNYKKISEQDFEYMASRIANNEELWEQIDFLILEELQNYERR